MARAVYFLDLIDDATLIAQYESWHEAGRVPPAVVAGIRRSGIDSMEIWRCADRLAMIVETRFGFDASAKLAADATDPDVQAWEGLMDTMQRRLPFSNDEEKWLPGRCIFDLHQH